MNLIKSIFIFIAPVWLAFVVYHGVIGLLNSDDFVFNTAIIISALPLLLFLAYIMLFQKLARTHEHLLSVSVPSFIGYVVVLILYLDKITFIKMEGMMLSMSAFIVTFLYVYWYSNNARNLSQLILNDNFLPSMKLKDENGVIVSSDSWLGKPTLIFFYRGNWCPLCMAQISEIAQYYKKFEEKGIQVIFIAPQSQNNTKKLAQKYNLGFKFYVDENNTVAKQLGLVHRFGLPMGFQALGYASDSVYPTVVAIDEKGVIIYNDQTTNYRIRPEPQELMKIFTS
jgi:peroxiredoxin